MPDPGPTASTTWPSLRMPHEADPTADQKQTKPADMNLFLDPNQDCTATAPKETELIKETEAGKCFFYAGSFFRIGNEEDEENDKFDI